MKKHVKFCFLIAIWSICLVLLLCAIYIGPTKKGADKMITFYHITASLEPWGDFSEILYNGYITSYEIYEKDRQEALKLCASGEYSKEDFDLWLIRDDVPVYPPNQRLLLRTGPFYVDFSSDLEYCSEAGKKWLEEHCPEVKFVHLVKFHTPELHWEEWDKTKDEPAEWPKGEVEGYIINEPHSQTCADSMPEFYEILPPRLRPEEVIQKLKENENRPFVFKILSGDWVFINQKGIDMLRESWNVENLKFEPRTMEELREEWHLY